MFAQSTPSRIGLERAMCQGDGILLSQATASAQGSWVLSPPFWKVKDLAKSPKGGEEPSQLALTPPRPGES